MSKIVIEEVDVKSPELRDYVLPKPAPSVSEDEIVSEITESMPPSIEPAAYPPDSSVQKVTKEDDQSEEDSDDEEVSLTHYDHLMVLLLPFLYAPDQVAAGQTCRLFNQIIRPRLRDVVIPDSFDITDDSLLPVINYAEHMRSLKIEFFVDPLFEPQEERAVRKGIEKRERDAQRAEVTDRESRRRRDEVRRERARIESSLSRSRSRSRSASIGGTARRSPSPIPSSDNAIITDFPQRAFDPRVFSQLRRVHTVDLSSCPQTESYNPQSSFLMKFISDCRLWTGLRVLKVPHCVNMRHPGITDLHFNDLQVALDGLNVHIGADLVGITHLKSQMPGLKRIICKDLFLFVSWVIWMGGPRFGKENWLAMDTHARNSGLRIEFDAREKVTLMIMPAEGMQARMMTRDWREISPFIGERVRDFFVPYYGDGSVMEEEEDHCGGNTSEDDSEV